MTTHTKPRVAPIDINGIMELMPHRFPLLMVDRILEWELGEWAVAIKNVTINEPFFVGHFPTHPVMPGVLSVEAMAQTAGCLVVASLDDVGPEAVVYFMSIENAKFRRPIVPGDQVVIRVRKTSSRRDIYKFDGTAEVDGVRVAEASFMAKLVRNPNEAA